MFPGDPSAPATWSGTPSGLISGLRAVGARVTPVSAEPAWPLGPLALGALTARRLPGSVSADLRASVRRCRRAARLAPELAALRTRVAGRRLRHSSPFDVVIQIGAGYTLDTSGRLVTYEDMTIPQALEFPYPDWQMLSARQVAARMARQQRAYDAATACCLTTHWAAESVIRDYGIAPAKVHAVGVGRNRDPRPVPRDWAAPRFLFVGIDWERKNGAAVVRAFTRLRAECPTARLDVVGEHPRLDVPGVTAHGLLRLGNPAEGRRLEDLFENATCFVMPSLHEPSAIAYVEAAAGGLPAIGTTLGGSRELIGAGGLVVDPHDEHALLDAMRALSVPDAAARMGAAALEQSARWTWAAVAQRILRALA